MDDDFSRQEIFSLDCCWPRRSRFRSWPAAGQAYTPEQEQACTGDAFRLCSAEIPDVGRVTACMVAKKSQLSPPCRAHFRPDPEPSEAVARPAGRPTVIRPATPRKP